MRSDLKMDLFGSFFVLHHDNEPGWVRILCLFTEGSGEVWTDGRWNEERTLAVQGWDESVGPSETLNAKYSQVFCSDSIKYSKMNLLRCGNSLWNFQVFNYPVRSYIWLRRSKSNGEHFSLSENASPPVVTYSVCAVKSFNWVFHDRPVWRISVRLSDRSKVTQHRINFIKNCPQ